MIEPILLTTLRIGTFDLDKPLTNATGFLFQRDERLFLVTANHVLFDQENEHFPSHVQIEFHTDLKNLTLTTGFSIPLYFEGESIWRGALDSGGNIDVAVVEIHRSALPEGAQFRAFGPENIPRANETIEIGSGVLAIGYPMGFHDQLHHLPIARNGTLASSFGIRFQGNGYFLVDARTHRGLSGAPVVMRMPEEKGAKTDLPWMLMGVHSARLEAGTREPEFDDVLGLNSAWYADILMMLTEPAPGQMKPGKK